MKWEGEKKDNLRDKLKDMDKVFQRKEDKEETDNWEKEKEKDEETS